MSKGEYFSPPHICECGRAMVIDRLIQGGYKLVCPRFNRSWHNLWLGGWSHQGVDVTFEGKPMGWTRHVWMV